MQGLLFELIAGGVALVAALFALLQRGKAKAAKDEVDRLKAAADTKRKVRHEIDNAPNDVDDARRWLREYRDRN